MFLFRLVSKLLKFARHNHYVLKGHGLATVESTNEFACIQRLLRGSSEVIWQDSTEARNNDGLSGVTFERLLQFPTLGCKLTRKVALTQFRLRMLNIDFSFSHPNFIEQISKYAY